MRVKSRHQAWHRCDCVKTCLTRIIRYEKDAIRYTFAYNSRIAIGKSQRNSQLFLRWRKNKLTECRLSHENDMCLVRLGEHIKRVLERIL